ncbi:ACT domain-containing protein [Plantibacter sp. Mn2098]|uniref:ACT domain-containing protein n=1 Tax=Plantibacter sp. Mn2098 TaxID=3395266 RepID=UPI003BE28570
MPSSEPPVDQGTDLAELLGSLRPEMRDGEYVFVSTDHDRASGLPALAMIAEHEGVTVVLSRQDAVAEGLDYDYPCRWITLTVHSSLHAVGLTAAFASALAEEQISCNVLAGFHHDHILVGVAAAERALATLRKLSGQPTPPESRA